MNRRSFLRIFPGLLAVKEISATLTPVKPIPSPATSGLYFQLQNGNKFIYNKSAFNLTMLKEVMSGFENEKSNKVITIPCNKSSYELFDQELRDRYKNVLNRYPY